MANRKTKSPRSGGLVTQDGRKRSGFRAAEQPLQGFLDVRRQQHGLGVLRFGQAAHGADVLFTQQITHRCVFGADGAGNEKIARIAGQQPEYLKLTLQRYRSGSGERIDPLMAANTKLMTDADIQAVVAYVSTMP